MHFTPNTKLDDPHDLMVARADQELAQAYDQIKSADEQLARLHGQLSKIERDSKRRSGRRRDRPVLRGLVGLILAAGICAAAFASQSSRADAAKAMIARWTPQIILASLPTEWSAAGDQTNAPTIQMAIADADPSQPVSPQQSAPQDAASTATEELRQLSQATARDVARLQEELEQLKTSHAQMLRDNAEAAQQIKAAQEQAARDNASTVEQVRALEEKVAAVSARSAEQSANAQTSAAAARQSAPPRRPGSTVSSAQPANRPR
jgi:septal ring factor EnvC (AmiA/AmiB activator)